MRNATVWRGMASPVLNEAFCIHYLARRSGMLDDTIGLAAQSRAFCREVAEEVREPRGNVRLW